MAPCTECNDENKENCSTCSIESSQTCDILCVCGSGTRPKSLMICSECDRWWHSGCVGLSGLTKSLTEKIEDWKCPQCFTFSAEIMVKLGEIDDRDLKGVVRREVATCLPDMLKKVEETFTTAFENFKAESMPTAGRSWAEVTSGEQKQLITEVVEQSSHTALTKSMQMINADLTEQRNRSNNIIISGAQETVGEVITDCVYSIVSPAADIPRADIVKAVRLGKAVPNKSRLILVTIRHEEDAKYLHNYKSGRKVDLEDSSGSVWINADLTRTERDAAFLKREGLRDRKKADFREAQSRGSGQQETGRDRRAPTTPTVRVERPPPPPYEGDHTRARSQRSNR